MRACTVVIDVHNIAMAMFATTSLSYNKMSRASVVSVVVATALFGQCSETCRPGIMLKANRGHVPRVSRELFDSDYSE